MLLKFTYFSAYSMNKPMNSRHSLNNYVPHLYVLTNDPAKIEESKQ